MRSRACPSFKVFSSPARLPQVLFINTILKLLWPHLSPAIHKMAMEQAKVPLEDVCKKVGRWADQASNRGGCCFANRWGGWAGLASGDASPLVATLTPPQMSMQRVLVEVGCY